MHRIRKSQFDLISAATHFWPHPVQQLLSS
jgi:hypothetical protein